MALYPVWKIYAIYEYNILIDTQRILFKIL